MSTYDCVCGADTPNDCLCPSEPALVELTREETVSILRASGVPEDILTEPAAREWELTEHEGYCMIVSGPHFDEMIHVVEKSALDRVIQERDEAYAAHKNLWDAKKNLEADWVRLSHELASADLEQLHGEVGYLTQELADMYLRYEERGAAMRDTGDMVRSLYVGSEVSKRVLTLREQLASVESDRAKEAATVDYLRGLLERAYDSVEIERERSKPLVEALAKICDLRHWDAATVGAYAVSALASYRERGED